MKFLTKKLGFLPAWAWGAGGVGGFFLVRYHSQNGYWPWQKNAAQAAQNQAYTSPTSPPDLAYEPGGELPLSSGGGFSGPGSGDDFSSLLSLLEALIAGRNQKPGPVKGGKKPPKKKPRTQKEKAQAGRGPGKNGEETWSGSGTSSKGKRQTAKPNGTETLRSAPTVRHHNGGREVATTGGMDAFTGQRVRGSTSPPANRNRQRPTRPIVSERANAQSHPVASHPKPKPPSQTASRTHPTPRPSSPPRRTVRRMK